MTHKIWHFWGGNKSDASTTSDNTVNDIAPLESETSGNRAATLDAWNLAKGGDSGASTWIDGVMNRSNSDPEKAYLLTLAKEDNIELNNPIKTWDTANPDLYKSAKNAEPKKIHSFTNPRLGYEAATDVLNSMKMEGRFNGDRISYLYNQHTEGNTTDPIYNYVKQHGVGVINGESRRISDAFYGKDAVVGYGGPLDTTENGEPYNRGFDYITGPKTKVNHAYIGDWSENALNEIDVATYHLTLWIDRKQDIQRNTYRNSGVVIAESGGSTFFNIDNLEITTISGSADQVTNVAPSITFTLTEPNGAAFFPKLLEVCRKKDIPTLQQAGYVLEVRFKGRNKTTGLPTKLPYMWKYNLAAIQVATKHNINASTYNFTSATMSNEVSKASWNTLDQTISLTETTTLGSAITDLENKLNDYHADKSIAMGYVGLPDKVKIKLPSEYKDWKFATPIGPTNTVWKEGARDWSLDARSSVKDFISRLVVHTSEMIERLDVAGSDVKPNTAEKVDHVTDHLIKYIKVKTDIEYGYNWDKIQQKYNETAIYEIVPFSEPPVVKHAMHEHIKGNGYIQKQKIIEITNERNLKKRYDYLNTGLNTEVLQFDATLDTAWFVPEAIYQSRTSYASKTTKSNITDLAHEDYKSSARTGLTGGPPGTPRTPDQLDSDLEHWQNKRKEHTGIIIDAQKQLESDAIGTSEALSLDQAIANSKKAIAQADKEQGIINQERAVYEIAEARGMQSKTKHDYLGDVPTDLVDFLGVAYKPVDIKRTGQDPQSGLLALDIQKRSITNDLLEIEIGIKGDPYWLGIPANDSPDSKFSSNGMGMIHRPAGGMDDNPDYDKGVPYFLFSMFFPKAENSGIGGGHKERKPYYNQLYSGVYKVSNIIHQFRGGMFQQYLVGLRVTDIDEEQVRTLVDALKPELMTSDIGSLQEAGPQVNDENIGGPKQLEGGGESGQTGGESDGPVTNILPAGPVPTTVAGKEQYVVDRLMKVHGLTAVQAAGIVGNLNRESALKTGARNEGDGNDGSDSIGIAQWNSGRADNLQAFAAANGKDWRDLGVQTDFIVHELKGSGAHGGGSESTAWGKLESAKTVRASTEAFTSYERFKNWNVSGNEETIERIAEAERININWNNSITEAGGM